ncbi:hypothetical protein ACTXJJ_06270 [Corynebacterium casei]|uniref:hypothetical protein n=1 Tax=Corynebacterium casei TaxID=160386 RepID=UPI003FCFD4A8
MAKATPSAPALGYRFPRDPENIPAARPERELFTAAGWGRGIYASAISRTLSPVALTVAVLLDVAAQIGPHVLIDTPGTDGLQGGLAAMLIGRSGAGKTATMTAARSVVTLLPDNRSGGLAVAGGGETSPLLRLGGLASGQALGERLKTVATEAVDAGGEPIGFDYSQEHDRALICFDEGTSLVKSSSGEGSILLETITTALTGGSLDGVRASRELSRVVPGGSYAASFMLGIQPGMAAPLLGQDSLGFTQRWLVIPALPDPADELLGAVLPRVETAEVYAPAAWLEKRDRPDMTQGWTSPANRAAAEIVPVDAAVAEEMARNRFRMARSDYDGELLDAHRDLFRVKLALPIALLEGERRISPRAWELAGIIMDISAETRSRAITEARDLEAAAAADREAVRIGARDAAEDKAMRAKIDRQADRLLEEARMAGACGLDATAFIRNRVSSSSRKGGGSCRSDAAIAVNEMKADGRLISHNFRYFIPEFAPKPGPTFDQAIQATYDDDDEEAAGEGADAPTAAPCLFAVAGSF